MAEEITFNANMSAPVIQAKSSKGDQTNKEVHEAAETNSVALNAAVYFQYAEIKIYFAEEEKVRKR